MKFFCITSQNDDKPLNRELLKAASKLLDFSYIDESNLPKYIPNEPYLLYRCVSKYQAPHAREIEKKFISPLSVTFYSKWDRGLYTSAEPLQIHSKFNLPIVPTSWPILPDSQDLSQEVERLGGYPVIVKSNDSSRGTGVFLCRSSSELKQQMAELNKDSVIFTLRKFINVGKPPFSYRGIVIGNKCVAVYKNSSTNLDEFRSNVDQGHRSREIVSISSSQSRDLVRSVAVLGLEFGAVDYLIDDQNNINILEVNFPFNFSPLVKDLKVPIHEMMVNYLVKKAQKHTASPISI